MGTITFLRCCFEKPGDGIIDNERRLNNFIGPKTSTKIALLYCIAMHSIKGFYNIVVIRACDLRSLS